MVDHLAFLVSQPFHHQLLWRIVVSACGTKVVSETVQSPVLEANFIVLGCKVGSQRVEYIADQSAARDVWAQHTTLGAVKDFTIRSAINAIEYFAKILVNGKRPTPSTLRLANLAVFSSTSVGRFVFKRD